MDQKSVPKWAMQPFRDFLDHMNELNQLTHVSARGISMLRGAPDLMEAVQAAERSEILRSENEHNISQEEAAKRLEQVKAEAELASQEVDKGFPLLYGQALVSLWGSLEDLIHTFLAAWITHEPEAKQAEALRKLRVSLGEYETLDDEDKGFYIIELLEKDLRSPLRYGVSRFEHLLKCFNLSGRVDSEVREKLFEMNHIRNVLVHRRGIADRRFVDACPHLGLLVGDRILVDRSAFDQYGSSVATYVLRIVERITDYFGVEYAETTDVIENADGRTL